MSITTKVISYIAEHKSLEIPREMARCYESRIDSMLPKKYWQTLTECKKQAVNDGDEVMAKACWCYETIGHIQDRYVMGFSKGKKDDFYGFWCDLEQCENNLLFLGRHYPIDNDEFATDHIRKHTKKFQQLFPYRFFISPGMIIKKTKCSICGQAFLIRGGCDHKVGEIYKGQMCSRTVENIIPLEVSIVENPVQKYSVLFSPEISYDYGRLRYVISGLRSPWHGWDYKTTKIITGRERFPGTGRNDRCPCGSGLKYKKCCQIKPKEREHYEIIFQFQPTEDFPTYLEDASFIVKGTPSGFED